MVSVADEYRECADAHFYPFYQTPYGDDGELIAYPYDTVVQRSLGVKFTSRTEDESSHQQDIRTSCQGFKSLGGDWENFFEFGASYPFGIGYYAWVELMLQYSEAEALIHRVARSYYYLAIASDVLRMGANMCVDYNSLGSYPDQFCSERDIMRQLDLIQRSQKTLNSTRYAPEEIIPEAVVDFNELIDSAIAEVRETSFGQSD